tara:strand:+ start:435 stop:557 length:123 start_codon:yes stop_codon:yes gene_type:complete
MSNINFFRVMTKAVGTPTEVIDFPDQSQDTFRITYTKINK